MAGDKEGSNMVSKMKRALDQDGNVDEMDFTVVQ